MAGSRLSPTPEDLLAWYAYEDIAVLEALGLVVSVERLGVTLYGKPVTHMMVHLHRYLMAAIIRSQPLPKGVLYISPHVPAYEAQLAAVRDAMLSRLRRRLETYVRSAGPETTHRSPSGGPAEVWVTPRRNDYILFMLHSRGGWLVRPEPLLQAFTRWPDEKLDL